jgi:hypothetical protein
MNHNLSQLDGMLALMEEEIEAYQNILGDLHQEWEFLKKNDTPALISLLKTKEQHVLAIQKIRGAVDQSFQEVLHNWSEPSLPQSLLDLASRLPALQGNRINQCHQTLARLKQEIYRLNEQNKRFIQESLNFIRGLFQVLTCPVQEETFYAPGWRKESPPPPSSWVSRKV